MKEINKIGKVIFKGIVGSTAYNLNTKTSDVDIKGVYIQSNEDILSNKYIPQYNVDKDTVYYEIRRFLELVSTGNPNVLELLYLPKRCVITSTKEWEVMLEYKEQFLTKKCYNAYSGYAKQQLKKAQGLNKKFNWEEQHKQRKDVLDFCRVIDRSTGNTFLVKEWNKSNIALSKLEHFRDLYKVYKYGNRPIADATSNQPRTTAKLPKELEHIGILYFNREAYSTHCRKYTEYQKWLKNRNENRVATNKKHGQQYDSKNIMHLVRLIMTAKEIPTEHKLNVDRTENRDYLLSIKKGKVNLNEIIAHWSNEVDKLKILYEESDLPDTVDSEFLNELELKLRDDTRY